MRNSKGVFFVFLFLITMLAFFPYLLVADAGPKPSVTIEIKGLEGESYYVTLLSTEKRVGPYNAFDKDNPESFNYDESFQDYGIFTKFVEYPLAQGYFFLQRFFKIEEDHRFSWNYYPPHTYRVLIYLPENDKFILSESAYTNYAFNSYFTALVSEDDITLVSNYNLAKEIFALAVRIIVTVLIEVGIAWLFKIRKRNLIWFIIVVNLITQLLLNVFLNLASYIIGLFIASFLFFMAEVVVFLIEAVLYSLFFKRLSNGEIRWMKATFYALVSNIASLVIGLFMAYNLSALF